MLRRHRWPTLVTMLALLAACGGGCTAARADDEAAQANAPAASAQDVARASKSTAQASRGASPASMPAAQASTPAAAPLAAPPATPSAAQQASLAAAPECVVVRKRIASDLANGEARLTRALQLDAAALRCIVAAVPALAAVSELQPFDDAAIDAALKRGKRSRGAIHVWQIEPAVLVWSPVPEQRLLVVSGQAGTRGFGERAEHVGAISVLRLGEDGSVEHLASALLDETEPGIALGSSEQYPRNLMWTTCYECPGAGGNIRFEDDASVSFLYR